MVVQILDALRHVNDCLVYMSKLRHKDIFRFCAIPQVMAMGTLNLCLNNHAVFEGVVKMRRGQTAKIFWTMTNFEDACAMFEHYARQMSLKIQVSRVSGVVTTGRCLSLFAYFCISFEGLLYL